MTDLALVCIVNVSTAAAVLIVGIIMAAAVIITKIKHKRN